MSGIDPLSVGLTVASTLLQGAAQSSAARRQKNIVDAMSAYRSQKAGEGQQAINNFLQTIQPGAKDAERTQVQDELRTGLDNSVGAVQKFQAPQQIAGKVSDDFDARTASNNATVSDRIKRAVDQLSIIGAPAEQGMREARRYGVTAGEVDATNSAANNVGARYQDALQTVRPDPFLSLASQLTQGAALAKAGGVFGAKTSPFTFAPVLTGGGLGLKMPAGANLGGNF